MKAKINILNTAFTDKVEVVLENGKKLSIPADNWKWINQWYAEVKFSINGQQFTVKGEMLPNYEDMDPMDMDPDI